MLTENLGGGSLCDCPSAWEGDAPPRAPGPPECSVGSSKGARLRGRSQGSGTPEGCSASAVITGEVKAAPLGRSQVVKVQTPQDLCAGTALQVSCPREPWGLARRHLCVQQRPPPLLGRPSLWTATPAQAEPPSSSPTGHGCPLTTPPLSLLRHLRTQWFRKGEGGMWGKRQRRGKRD